VLKTTVIGSYPVPEWLKLHPTAETLIDALTVVLRAQEAAGLDVIADGELGRWDLTRNAPGGMIERFVRPLQGVQTELTRTQLEHFQARTAMSYRGRPAGVVIGPLGEGTLDLKRDFERARQLTCHPLKFTITSPYMMAKVLDDHYYTDFERLTLALADLLASQLRGVGADVVQVDEANLPGSPQDGELAAHAINRVLDAAESPERAVHLCFGNYRGQRIQSGDYSQLIDFMNRLRCDHLLVEMTRRSASEIERLREVAPPKRFGLGVIDVKDLQIEEPETVARRIEALAQRLGEERLAYVNPDCGLGVLPRVIADAKLRALVAGRDLFLGRQQTDHDQNTTLG
jgi:5-methyltetrahydropteroyltriglutamate--homocysteine methyltransferase